MSKPCCATGDTKPTPSWKVWMKRTWLIILIVIVFILLWNQLQLN